MTKRQAPAPAPTLPDGFRMETKMYIPFMDDEPLYKGTLFRWVKRPLRKSYHWKKVHTYKEDIHYEYAITYHFIDFANRQLAAEAAQK